MRGSGERTTESGRGHTKSWEHEKPVMKASYEREGASEERGGDSDERCGQPALRWRSVLSE